MLNEKRYLTAAVIMTLTMALPAYGGQWMQDGTNWWYQNDDSSFPTNGWTWIDGDQDGFTECYYFDEQGYVYRNTTTPDGCQVNESGAWVIDGVVQTQGDTLYTLDKRRLADRIIQLTNEKREEIGEDTLVTNENLMGNAQTRAEEANRRWSHTRPDGSSCATAVSINYSAIGENLFGGNYKREDTLEYIAQHTVSQWMESTQHKENLLDSKWEETGVGISYDKEFILSEEAYQQVNIIQIFIRK